MANPLADPADPFRAGRHSARARLVGLRDPADRGREPTGHAWRSTEPADEPPEPLDSTQPLDLTEPDGRTEQRSGRGEHRRTAERQIGHLVRRWTPGPVRDARWDPGRPGALMLSAVTALAAVMAAVGVWWGRPVAEPVPALPVLPAAAPASAPPAPGAPSGELVISVVGKVATPGLVRVPDGARVADALDAAGGALPGTDLSLFNLARRLADGEQLLVGIAPPPGQPVDGGVPGAPGGVLGAPAPAVGGAPGMIDLNVATLEQLDTLPGVGPVTAQSILDWRAANGRFTSVDQLREVDGIGEVRFGKIKDRVRV